jgi:3-methyladenine DNA glycosylase Tag
MSEDAQVSSAPEASEPVEQPVKDNDSWDDDEPEQEEDEQPKRKSPPKAEEKPEPKPAPKMRKVKVGDTEELVDEDEVFRDVQKYKAADKKFREAAEMQKQVEQFMTRLQEDPEAILNDSRVPLKRRELAEKWLLQELENEMADPRDLKVKEYEQKLAEYQERERQEQEAYKAQELEQKKELKRREISESFTKALESTPLSKTPEVAAEALRDMALYLRAARANGENPDPAELADHVNTKYYKAAHSLLSSLDPDDALEFLGPELVKKLNKATLAKHRASQEMPSQQFKNDEVEGRPKAKPKYIDPYTARQLAREKLFGK